METKESQTQPSIFSIFKMSVEINFLKIKLRLNLNKSRKVKHQQKKISKMDKNANWSSTKEI